MRAFWSDIITGHTINTILFALIGICACRNGLVVCMYAYMRRGGHGSSPSMYAIIRSRLKNKMSSHVWKRGRKKNTNDFPPLVRTSCLYTINNRIYTYICMIFLLKILRNALYPSAHPRAYVYNTMYYLIDAGFLLMIADFYLFNQTTN